MIESRFSMKFAAALLCVCLGATAAAQESTPAVTGSAEAGAAKAAVCTAHSKLAHLFSRRT